MSLIYSNIPELEGTDTEITLANLSQLESELERLFEKRIAHLCELSRAIISDGGDVDLAKSIILSIRSDGEIDSDTVSAENTYEIGELFSKISFIERLVVLKEVFGEMPMTIYSNDEAVLSPSAKNRIAYMKNSYNDLAFSHFADLLGDAKASYPESVTGVCERVLNGKSEFCILPIETMRDGRLISFYEAIINYNLKICAEYDLANADGVGYTRYALLGKSVIPINRFKNVKNNGEFLEITYSDDNISLIEILNAAQYFSLKLESVDTLVIDKLGETKRFCAVFSAAGADIDAFMTYLTVDCPDVLLIGLYQRI